jgi:transcriptional regulator of met regulon
MIPSSFHITLSAEVQGFLISYCDKNKKSLDDAISIALKILKVADDAKYRNETLALIKKNEESEVVTEIINGY